MTPSSAKAGAAMRAASSTWGGWVARRTKSKELLLGTAPVAGPCTVRAGKPRFTRASLEASAPGENIVLTVSAAPGRAALWPSENLLDNPGFEIGSSRQARSWYVYNPEGGKGEGSEECKARRRADRWMGGWADRFCRRSGRRFYRPTRLQNTKTPHWAPGRLNSDGSRPGPA